MLLCPIAFKQRNFADDAQKKISEHVMLNPMSTIIKKINPKHTKSSELQRITWFKLPRQR